MKALDSIMVSIATLALLCSTIALYLVFFYAPVELTMGIVQKIFYVHVPSAMMMYAGFVICSAASIFYLMRPNNTWDAAAVAGAEIGLFFGLFVIISGPLWAFKAWGKWWEFDPQLTATLVLYMMYGGYALLRAFSGPSRKVRQLASVLAILAATSIPFVHWAVKIWGGVHPTVEREGGDGLADQIATTFGTSMLAFLLLFIAMFWLQLSLRKEQDKVESLYVEVEDYLKSTE